MHAHAHICRIDELKRELSKAQEGEANMRLQLKRAREEGRQLLSVKQVLAEVQAGAHAQLEHVRAASAEHAALLELVHGDVERGERARAREMEREHERVRESERQRQREHAKLLEREREHALERESAREQEWEREKARERDSAAAKHQAQLELERERARATEAVEQLRRCEREAAAEQMQLLQRVSSLEADLEKMSRLEDALATAGLSLSLSLALSLFV